MVGIYKITNKVNSKVYVGQGTNLSKRWSRHKNLLVRDKHYNKYLQRAWNKYGENNFIFDVIEECSQIELDNREIYWIKKLDTFANGYNLTNGGFGTIGCHPSLETRAKISRSLRGLTTVDKLL